MIINLRIKADVNNLTLSEIYQLLAKYSSETKNKNNFYEFKGFIFKIEADVNMSIDYVITEVSSKIAYNVSLIRVSCEVWNELFSVKDKNSCET